MKPILHLNVKRKWFNMIISGEKKEEYRETSAYWTRIFSAYIRIKGKNYHPTDVEICFSNGYNKNRPHTHRYCGGLRIGYGKSEWGAEPEKQYFILKIGEPVIKI